MIRKSFIAAAFATLTAISPFIANAGTDLGTVGNSGYRLQVNDNGVCVAVAEFINGYGLALSNWQSNWEFSLGHKDWKLEEGRGYRINFSIDGKSFYGDVTGKKASNGLSLVTGFMTKELLHSFTAGNTLTVYHSSGVPLGSFTLKGTTEVVTAVAQCAQVVEEVRNTTPFAPNNSTPFASAQERGA